MNDTVHNEPHMLSIYFPVQPLSGGLDGHWVLGLSDDTHVIPIMTCK